MTVDHPQFGTMCCICFRGLTPDECAVDNSGQKWDVCRGQCARDVWDSASFPEDQKISQPRTPSEDR